MFRILIVEDFENTLKLLQNFLKKRFPDSKIDTAQNTKGAVQLIRTASERGLPYDAAVLDFKLPEAEGENPEVNESLCHIIRERMPEAIVLHFTGYPEDLLVQRHMEEFHHDRRDPYGEKISKKEEGWTNQLVKVMKAYLYGTRIEAQMDKLFGTGEQSNSRPWGRTRYSGPRSERLTYALADLERDIIAYWDDLDERLKTRILNRYHVEKTESGSIQLSLL